jgi:enoyl-CoA hydratase/carnithine racemase
MRVVNGVEAHAIGLVERLVEEPDGAALELASEIAALQGPVVTRVKEIVSDASGHSGALVAERRGNRNAWDGSVNAR